MDTTADGMQGLSDHILDVKQACRKDTNNLWMLFNALAKNPSSITLIALWNGEEGDGPGGTGDLVEQTKQRGHKTIVLPAKNLAKLTRDD